ncbi:MAG: tetratricopeptide repeat protein, partial [Sphingomicrobium sp.]
GAVDEPLQMFVEQARKEGRSVELEYNIDAASLSENQMNLVVPICAARIEETSVKAIGGCSLSEGEKLSGMDIPIARAMAARSESRPTDAINEATHAIDSGQLNEHQLRMALRTRIGATKFVHYALTPRSDAADRQMLAILRDTKRLFKLKPLADVAIELSVTLRNLGDYEQAQQVLEEAAKRWPDDDISIDYERSALARQVDEPGESLGILNAMAAKHGPMDGMRFYYHRGWTLTNLGRFDEAIADFTVGINGQPDYHYAYFRRACAYAQIGDLKRALSDLNDGIGQIDSLPAEFVGGAVRRDRARASEAMKALKSDVSAGKTETRPDVCSGYFSEPDTPRMPSRYLDAAAKI